MASLKNEIIGSWRLLSYIEVPVGGGESIFPLGKSPKGILIYSPDGFMSVQISTLERASLNFEDRFVVTEDLNLVNQMQKYIAFTGKYLVDNTLACVIYHIETSYHPNWENSKQIRKLDFEGDILYQKSIDPILSGGQLVHAYMTWKKSEKFHLNSENHLEDEVMEK